MDFDARDVDPLGERPISSATARDILSNPRWAYLLFELSVIDNQDRPQTADELADRLQLSPDTVSNDLEALIDKSAVRTTSGSIPRYKSAGCYFYADNWVELPDGERVEMIPKPMFGAVGYSHIDTAVQRVIDENGYGLFHTAVIIYHSIVRSDEPEDTLENMFPEFSDEDIVPLRSAVNYSYGRLSEDPLWALTYDIEYSTEA
jgi:DNA-binding Lrp family transcriptional regulator